MIRHNEKFSWSLVIQLVIILIINDYAQYTFSKLIYFMFMSLTLFWGLFIHKDFWTSIMHLLLITTERSRFFYDEVNFNSILQGPAKYGLVIFITVVFIIFRKKLNASVFLLLLFVFTLGLTVPLVSFGFNFYWAVGDITQFCYYFLLPILLCKLFSQQTSDKVLRLYQHFCVAYPVSLLILIAFGRFNFSYGALIVNYSALLLVNAVFLTMLLLYHKPSGTIASSLILTIFCMILAPSSGQALFYLMSLIVGVTLMNKFQEYRRLAFFISAVITIIIIITYTVVTLFPELFAVMRFLNHKANQILALFFSFQLTNLPFSVHVRVVEYANVFFHYDLLVHLFGHGFGGFFTENVLDFRNLNTTAFSQEEIENSRYYNTHSFISNIYMHYGLVGAVFYIIFLRQIFNDIQSNRWFFAIVFVGLCVSFWGVQVVAIISFILAAVLAKSKNKITTIL